jgi:hypothetical protein
MLAGADVMWKVRKTGSSFGSFMFLGLRSNSGITMLVWSIGWRTGIVQIAISQTVMGGITATSTYNGDGLCMSHTASSQTAF